MQPHPLTNFHIQKYHQNEAKFNGVYLRNNLPEVKDGAYVINLDEYKSIGTHWITLNVNGDNITYFDSCGVDHNPKDIEKFTGNKNMTTTIFRIQAYDSVMFGYFCIGFIDFMLKGKSLLDHTNLFSPNRYKKSDKIILKYFQYILKRLKLKNIVLCMVNIENLKTLKYIFPEKKKQLFLLVAVIVIMKININLKKESKILIKNSWFN